MTDDLTTLLAGALAEHALPSKVLSFGDDAWLVCSCDKKVDRETLRALFLAHVASVLAETVGEWLTSDRVAECGGLGLFARPHQTSDHSGRKHAARLILAAVADLARGSDA